MRPKLDRTFGHKPCNKLLSFTLICNSRRVVSGTAATSQMSDETSDRSVSVRIVDYHPIAIQASAKELVCRPRQIQAKATIVELTELLDDEFAVGIEIACPLLEREEIAVAVVEDFQNVERRPGKLGKKIMQNEKGVVSGVNVLHHERRQLVFLVHALPSRKIFPPGFSSETNFSSTRSYCGRCSITPMMTIASYFRSV